MPVHLQEQVHRLSGSANLVGGLFAVVLLFLSVYGIWVTPVPLFVASLGLWELWSARKMAGGGTGPSALFSVVAAAASAPVVGWVAVASMLALGEGSGWMFVGIIGLCASALWVAAQAMKLTWWLGDIIERSL